MKLLKLDDHAAISEFWQRELGWAPETCAKHFTDEAWDRFLHPAHGRGEAVFWRVDDEGWAPSIWFFRLGDDIIEVSDGRKELERHTPWGDPPTA